MSTLDRVVRDIREHLEPMEGLVGSVLGRERGGRRRVALIATDRRVLVVTLRGEPPASVDYGDIEQIQLVGGDDGPVLRISTADTRHEVDRIGDERARDLLVELVRSRSESWDPLPTPPPRVRIIA